MSSSWPSGSSLHPSSLWFAAQQTNLQPKQQPKTVFIRVDGEWRNVSINQITYVSGMKDYVLFYLDGEKKPLISHLTMKAVEEILPSDSFLRIHRSYIVAVDKIKKVDRNDCVYIGEEIIHIPDSYQQAFNQFLASRSIERK
jgi:DNA-binding LytR/AlgR family response regulator